MFDAIGMVDWSAANVPRQGRDSIWICWRDRRGERFANPPTRHAARALLDELLTAALDRGERVLIGFDFPFGYPAGFAARLGLAGPPWRVLWDEIARLVEDGSDNRNNRFAAAAELNRRVSDEPFPFWGCPAGKAGPYLAATHPGRYRTEGLAERRLIDGRAYMPGAQPCWKLCYAGSVGGQALTGIPVVRALRDDPRWHQIARVWPFETGLAAPDGARVVFAEIYPSLWPAMPQPGEPKDKAQVREVVRFLAARRRDGDLAALFAGDPDLTAEQRRRVESEEAWTLGVTAPKHPAKTPSPPAERGERVGVRGVDDEFRRNQPSPGCGLMPAATLSRGAGEGIQALPYTYLRDPAAIARRSFALIRQEVDLGRFPRSLRPLALRLAHAAGDASILADLAWSEDAVAAGRKALAAGASILVDAEMVAAGIMREHLPAANPVVCTLRSSETARLAREIATTRSAAAVELWRPRLAGAVVAIGNAPTALFHLLERLAAGDMAMPALVLGFPVGFVGAAEAKAALAGFGRGLAYVTLFGRRGGSALAAAAVNALASEQ
jgi:precorrin-8X/cobalt-precorrin-8 methylmutase